MRVERPQPRRRHGVPPGTPSWITPELIAQTLRVFQPRYKEPLTESDAVGILQNLGRLFDCLGKGG